LLPERATRAAGRILLEELDRLTGAGESFALESTLSGRTYLEIFKRWKEKGYRIEIVFLKVNDPKICLSRVAARVKQGGHDVPRADVLRRRVRGWDNFMTRYRDVADAWWIFDAMGPKPVILEKHP
jgi:predicted ABC-type ATPase